MRVTDAVGKVGVEGEQKRDGEEEDRPAQSKRWRLPCFGHGHGSRERVSQGLLTRQEGTTMEMGCTKEEAVFCF